MANLDTGANLDSLSFSINSYNHPGISNREYDDGVSENM